MGKPTLGRPPHRQVHKGIERLRYFVYSRSGLHRPRARVDEAVHLPNPGKNLKRQRQKVWGVWSKRSRFMVQGLGLLVWSIGRNYGSGLGV